MRYFLINLVDSRGKIVEVVNNKNGIKRPAVLNSNLLDYRHIPISIDGKHAFQWLVDKKAKDTISYLENIIGSLEKEDDCKKTKLKPGSPKFNLSLLLGWARANPEASWRGDYDPYDGDYTKNRHKVHGDWNN